MEIYTCLMQFTVVRSVLLHRVTVKNGTHHAPRCCGYGEERVGSRDYGVGGVPGDHEAGGRDAEWITYIGATEEAFPPPS